MRSVSPALLALIVSLSLPVSLASQSAPKVLRVNPFTGTGLSASEASAVQSLVTSYIAEYKSYRVIDAAGQEQALKEAEAAIQLGVTKDLAPLAADFILSANAQSAGGLIVFTMDLTRVSTGEKRNVAKAAASVNDLILSLRGLSDSLFDRSKSALAASPAASSAQVSAASQSATAAYSAAATSQAPLDASAPAFLSAPSLALIIGTWSGDKGVDRVTILKDGHGIAILSSGNSMRVKASVSGSSVIVIQDQPSSAEFYKGGGLDLKAARTVAAQARPWRWIFSLTEDKSSLIGTKESVSVQMDKGTIAVDNGYIREARWNRLFQ